MTNRAMSNPEFARTISVSPPMVNKKIGPTTANNIGVLYCIEPPHYSCDPTKDFPSFSKVLDMTKPLAYMENH